MRFLIWTERFYPDCGGLELSMYRLALDLVSLTHEVEVVTSREEPRKNMPFPVIALGKSRFLERSMDYICERAHLWDCLYLARLAQGRERDHVNRLAPLLGKIQLVLRIPSTGNIRRVRRADSRQLLSSAKAILICQNPQSVRQCKQCYPTLRVTLSRNRVFLPRDYGVSYQSYFLFAARLAPSKNLHTLARAWKAFESQAPAPWSELRVFGTPYERRYADECLGLLTQCRRATYFGEYEQEDYRVIDRASFVVIPSFREGHSNVMLEALSVGTPVIASTIPGIEEDLGDDRGFLLNNPRDVDELRWALAECSSLSETAYAAMSSAARRRAEQLFRETPKPVYGLLALLGCKGAAPSCLLDGESTLSPNVELDRS